MKKFILSLSFTMIIICLLHSDPEKAEWDVKNYFNNSIYKEYNVELNYQNDVPVYYSIKNKKYIMDEYTDLYLSFDNEKNIDDSGKYDFIYKQFLYSKNRSVYNKSAYFVGDESRLELVGTKNSFFQSGINLSSFSISFWVYPVSFSNNEIVLRIGSQYYDKIKDTVEDQSIYAKLNDGRIIWEFKNLFKKDYKTKNSLIMESYNRVLPEKWTHINLTYDANTGIIKEYINGIEEGVLIATENGELDSSVLNLKYNPNNRCIIILAPTFYGAIDEFRIVKKVEKSNFKKYIPEGGVLLSKVEDFGPGGIFINEIITSGSTKNNTDIIYFYRYSNTPFHEEDKYSSNIEWHILGTEDISLKLVRYFQWKVQLLSGNNGNHSPRFRKLALDYKKNDPPSIPKGLQIVAGDGQAAIKWLMNSEKDLKGYKIYYGTSPGIYFGVDSKEGYSPIDVGINNVYKITGLKNNIIYYFSVTAYDNENNHESKFSEEIAVRPMKSLASK